MVKIANDTNFNDLINDGRVVVDYYADWCGPCQIMKPVFEEISKENNNINFICLNIDDYPSVAQKYGVVSIPTYIIFENGQPVKKQLGAISKEDFESFIKKETV